MAHTDNESNQVRMSFPILKSEETADGDILVWGKATDASIDSDDQIVDADWSGKALEEWLKSGANIRVQHSPYLYPAGKGVEVALSDEGHWVKALVVEPTAKELVRKGVLQAFSVGIGQPQIIRDLKAKNGRINGGKLVEISLVDRPANANCGFTMVKSAAGTLTDTDEIFGDLEAALAAAETRVDAAIPDAPVVDPRISDWVDARHDFLSAMPEDPKSDEWAAWKAEKDLLFTGDDAVRTWAYKRDMDPGVGGGVDRDKVPDEDFAGPNRTYPIVTPGDVSDAASLIGHAQNPDEVKRNIVAIANRKGKDFVAALPDSWKDGKAVAAEIAKGQKDCTNCGKNYDADAKTRNCENCGSKLPAGDDSKSVEADVTVTEEVEAEKSEAPEFGPLPYALKRLHDLTCGVYSDEAITREYAALKSFADGINVEAVRAYSGDEMAEIAEMLKSADPEMIADARAQLHNAFKAANDGVADVPVSSGIAPGRFNRGYLTADHARQSADGMGASRIPTAGSQPSPGDFDRGYLTDGEARQSPGSSNSQKSGKPDASAYTANFMANQLANIHDHYSERRPEICAFAPTSVGVPADMNSTSVPTNVSNATAESSPAKGVDADYVKALVDSAILEIKAENAELRKQIDILGAQPDPTQAPVRGVVAKLAGSGITTPAEKELVTEPTEDEKLMAYIQKSGLLSSGDPNARMMAEAGLKELQGRLNKQVS